MNILYVNTNFHEGGAAKVARQLYYGMKERGHNVYFLAGYPSKDDEECIIMNASSLSRFYNLATGILQNNQVLSRKKARKQILDIVKEKEIDIVHFHNLFENYIGMKDIAYIAQHCRVVWTLHDMWAVTGHCAFSLYCDDWKKGCPHCEENRFYPAFYYNDIKYKYEQKRKYFTGKNITYVTPSHWLEQVCRESLFENETIHVIENGINTAIYRPVDRKMLRKKYEIPEEKMVLFFTAAVVEDWRKGIRHLLKALSRISGKENYVLLVAGNGDLQEKLPGFEIRSMGFVSDEEKMNELYNLADLYVNPSMAESFGCTTVEAAAAGTPVVAFASGALAEIVTEHMGWSVEPGNEKLLYEMIMNAAENKESLYEKGLCARKKVEELYSEQKMLDRYEELYRQIVE